jgi:tetratricopeptide (TPR) repeat protein
MCDIWSVTEARDRHSRASLRWAPAPRVGRRRGAALLRLGRPASWLGCYHAPVTRGDRPSSEPGSAIPEGGGALRDLAQAIAHRERGRLDEAERLLARLVARDDRDVTVLVNAGIVARERNDLATALARLSRAVYVMPRNAVARAELGIALASAGRIEEARRELARALELAPGLALAQRALAALPGERG